MASSTTRFLGRPNINNMKLEPPAAESLLDELDERDVVWYSSSSSSAAASAAAFEPDPKILNCQAAAASPVSNSPISSSPSPRYHFHNATAGLSAALTVSDGADEDGRSSPLFQRRKTALNPSLSPAAISTVVPSYTAGSAGGLCALSRSAPVKVPIWNHGSFAGARRGMMHLGQFDEEEEDKFNDDGEMVPPHEIVARSHKTTTFSVFEGVGRTLKGRDLTAVRNTVMQKTGFLE